MTHSPARVLKFWLSAAPHPPPKTLLCFVLWWIMVQSTGYWQCNILIAYLYIQCHNVSCLLRELCWLSQGHIVILDACVCPSEARVSWSSDVTPLALVFKKAMTFGDPQLQSTAPSPHILTRGACTSGSYCS